MQSQRLSVLVGSLLALGSLFSGVKMRASTPEFAVTATNVTMPASGLGSSKYTVTAIPMTGTVALACTYAGTSTEAKVPGCTQIGPPVPVTAGEALSGTIVFYPYGSTVPLSLPIKKGYAPAAGLALAGVLLLGSGLRRMARGRLSLMVFAVGTLAGLVGVSACSGGMMGMTPGTYQYTISANNESGGNTPLGQQATTTISVTVP